jgi:dihydrolipoamide dehydrogenase
VKCSDRTQASVWSRLGAEVTVVEFLGQVGGPGMDNDVAKQTQKFLTKQGLKFKLNTKVTAGEVEDAGVKVHVEAAKGGKEETVGIRHAFFSRLANIL